MATNDETSTSHEHDPAAVWWGQQPARRVAHIDEPVPPLTSAEWRWHWSRWFGIMYGPIPVGLIIGLPILIAIRM
jgi:hypothetical protein